MKLIKRSLVAALFTLTSCADGVWVGLDSKVKLEGERLPITNVINSPSYHPKEILLPAPIKNSGWYKSNSVTSAEVQNLFLTEPLQLDKKFSIATNENFSAAATPIIVNGKMYVADSDGLIQAFDIATGNSVWISEYFITLSKKSIFDTFQGKYLNGGISYHAGLIFVTSGLGEVVALSETDGSLVWGHKLSSPSRATPLATDAGLVLFQTIDNKVYALDIKTGDVVWGHVGISDEINLLQTYSPISFEQQIIVQYTSGDLYALDLMSGQEIWAQNINPAIDHLGQTTKLQNVLTSPTIASGNVYAFSNDGYIASINAQSGQMNWKERLRINKQIWIAGGTIFGVNTSNKILAINASNGNLIWELDAIENNEKSGYLNAPIIANNKLLIVSSIGQLFYINPNKPVIEATIAVVSDVHLPPMVSDGELYLVSDDGYIAKY
ncbi:MAG: PQQ-binding-like beta-propeller repeat protein [Rickettsiales bacterium]